MKAIGLKFRLANFKKEKKFSFKSIILGLGAFLIVSMSLFQMPFKGYFDEFIRKYDEYFLISKKRNVIQDSLLSGLGKTLSINEFKQKKRFEWGKSEKIMLFKYYFVSVL